MEQSDSDIREIHTSRGNILKQLKTLGYQTEEYDSIGLNEVNTMFMKNQLDMLVKNDQDKKVYVKYHIVSKTLRQNNIDELIEDLINIEGTLDKTDTILIIIKDIPNDTINNMIKQIWLNQNIFITVRGIKTLQFNIFEHSYVPKHSILNEEEVVEFKNRYNIIKDDMIPEISRYDPVALALLMKPGEICKIERQSRTAILSDFYRICI